MFYHYSQNNSGGYFNYYPDKGISHYVIIEASSAKSADARAEGVGLYFDGSGDCQCCGNRWSKQWNDDQGKEVPSIYGTPVEEYNPKTAFLGIKWIDGYETFVHYADGSFKGFHP